ncbi:transposase [Catenulispora yoronensis]
MPVASAPSDLTDNEWRYLVSILGVRPRGNGRNIKELEAKRRSFNGVRFKLANNLPWSKVPARYGKAYVCYENHRGYEATGLYSSLYRKAQGNTSMPELVDWLRIMAENAKQGRQSIGPTVDAYYDREEPRINLNQILRDIEIFMEQNPSFSVKFEVKSRDWRDLR